MVQGFLFVPSSPITVLTRRILSSSYKTALWKSLLGSTIIAVPLYLWISLDRLLNIQSSIFPTLIYGHLRAINIESSGPLFLALAVFLLDLDLCLPSNFVHIRPHLLTCLIKPQIWGQHCHDLVTPMTAPLERESELLHQSGNKWLHQLPKDLRYNLDAQIDSVIYDAKHTQLP